MFLLDTVVLSELRKPQRQRNRNLVRWIGEVSSRDLFISVVTIGEIERGIERQRQLDPAFAESLAVWLDTVSCAPTSIEFFRLTSRWLAAGAVSHRGSAIRVSTWRWPLPHLNMG
jgi:predicted nucleic acid-binding protein